MEEERMMLYNALISSSYTDGTIDEIPASVGCNKVLIRI